MVRGKKTSGNRIEKSFMWIPDQIGAFKWQISLQEQ
jgi:hypothetical protein